MDLVVEYNKNDFFYYNNSIQDAGLVADTGKRVECPPTRPHHHALKQQMCNNKKLADKLLTNTTSHSGADEMYSNTISKHGGEVLTTFNMTVGVIAGVFLMFKL
jgi:hypothetical protein